MMDGSSQTPTRDQPLADPDPVLSFVETGDLDPCPRQLVERLLYARGLLQANAVLAPRFVLGDCAAAHHIVLGGLATGLAATDRLRAYGFRVEPWRSPAGIRCFLSSSHSEAEIRALLVAITIVVRQLTPDDAHRRQGASPGCRAPGPGRSRG
jgi:hypothetical protein